MGSGGGIQMDRGSDCVTQVNQAVRLLIFSIPAVQSPNTRFTSETMIIESLEDRIVAYILVCGIGDWIAMSSVYNAVDDEAPAESGSEKKRLAMRAIRRLIESQMVTIGWPKWDTAGGFDDWEGSVEAKVARVEAEWPIDGPDMGEIAWLRMTEHGKATAIEILDSGYQGRWPTRFGE